MNTHELKQIGFSEKKAALYMAVLHSGSGSVAELANTAGIKRTTAYDILDELCRENLVTVSFSGKKRIFVAEPPENLNVLVERQTKSVNRLLPSLKEIFYSNTRPRVRYYEGIEGLKKVHDELLAVKSKEYFYFGSMRGFVDAMGKEYIDDFIQKRIRKKIWANALRIRNQEIDEPLTVAGETNLRRVRYLSKPLYDDVANLTLFEDKIGICSTSSENYALVIESREMYTILRFIWDCLWENAEE